MQLFHTLDKKRFFLIPPIYKPKEGTFKIISLSKDEVNVMESNILQFETSYNQARVWVEEQVIEQMEKSQKAISDQLHFLLEVDTDKTDLSKRQAMAMTNLNNYRTWIDKESKKLRQIILAENAETFSKNVEAFFQSEQIQKPLNKLKIQLETTKAKIDRIPKDEQNIDNILKVIEDAFKAKK